MASGSRSLMAHTFYNRNSLEIDFVTILLRSLQCFPIALRIVYNPYGSGLYRTCYPSKVLAFHSLCSCLLSVSKPMEVPCCSKTFIYVLLSSWNALPVSAWLITLSLGITLNVTSLISQNKVKGLRSLLNTLISPVLPLPSP